MAFQVGSPPVPGPAWRAAHRLVPALLFEPTIGVHEELLFLTSLEPVASGPIREFKLAFRSADAGTSWAEITPRILDRRFPPDTLDPYLHLDTDTGRIFLSQLQWPLLCSTLSRSDDHGETWTNTPLGCGQPPGGHDHPTLFTARPRVATPQGYPNVVYYCVNRVLDAACARSLDGGDTFGPLVPLPFETVRSSRLRLEAADPTRITQGVVEATCSAGTGHGVAAPDGTIYIATANCGPPRVAYSRDDGLTWGRSEISSEDVYLRPPDPIEGRAFEHDVELAVDGNGTVYAAWIGADQLPRLASSRDGAATWSPPVPITPSEIGAAWHVSIAAGGPGQVALSFVASSSTKDYFEMDAGDTWDAYLLVVSGAESGAPSIVGLRVNPPGDPVARGVCGGTRCGMGDFLDLVIDANGRPWAAFVDACNGPCVEGGESDRPEGLLGTLAEGPSLRGGSLPALPAPRPG